MHRRVFLTAALAAALPGLAEAQNAPPPTAGRAQRPDLITPQNELERAFIAALTDENERAAFRRLFLASQVSLALVNDAADAPPREVAIGHDRRAGAIFSSSARQSEVLGPASARRVMSGRQALTVLSGRNVVLNYGLTPMLTLEPEDVADWLGG